MASLPLNIPIKTALQSTQEPGVTLLHWLSASDAVIVLSGPAGTFSLQAWIERTFNPVNASTLDSQGRQPITGASYIPGSWQPVGSPMTAAGSYTLTGIRSGPLRLTIESGNPAGITASVTTT